MALSLLTASVGSYPTSSGHHHLALALSRAGPSQNLQAAIEQARASVEGDPSEVRHWHLLGLLLAVTGDWSAAKSVLEFAVSAAEDLAKDHDVPQSPPARSSLNIRDFASSEQLHDQANGHANGNAQAARSDVSIGTILDPADTAIPLSDTLLQRCGDRPPPSRNEQFEYALQVRMTQLALTEFVAGAEGVSEKWLEVFQWFREKRGGTVDDRTSFIRGQTLLLTRWFPL